MPRLTPEEYKQACDMGMNPDKLTLKELGKLRHLSTIDPSDQPRQMGYQPVLFALTPEPPPRPTVAPEYPEGSTPKERFQIFDTKNPHIKTKLRRMALELKRKGHQHYGIKALIEVLRWDYAVRTQSGGDFKINNAFATPYAYILMEESRELRGFFKTRKRRETSDG